MLPVLARAAGLVAVDKPAGLPVIPGRHPGDRRCVRDELAAQLGTRVWVCHRLDRDTTGVVVLATTADAHRVASQAFERGQVSKRYLALVRGELSRPLDIERPLTAGRRHTVRVARPGEAGKPAATHVEPVMVFPRRGLTLVAAMPATGRQHQIRVHLAAEGHPLAVDPLYGEPGPLTAKDLGGDGEEIVLARTPLHAEALELAAAGLTATAPLHRDMSLALQLLRSAGP